MSDYMYQFCLLGNSQPFKKDVTEFIADQISSLGLSNQHIELLFESDVQNRNRKAPCAAIFFGYDGADVQEHPELDELIEDSLLIVPVIESTKKFGVQIPKKLSHYNGISDPGGYQRACTAVLEHFRLLRSERRLFISYKRDESTSIAHQLYDAFDKNGYDVFLDTRSIGGGAIFQDVLWHRMVDSDVVVLLDSPHFHKSEWTQAEYARALSSNIHIEHLLWPDVESKASAALDEFRKLSSADFQSSATIGNSARLEATTVEKIVRSTESARARALSARNTALIDGFCDLAREKGFTADLQPGLSIKLTANGNEIAVMPIIGVPTAARLHQLVAQVTEASSTARVWALYDHFGILDSVLDHIQWLNDNLPLLTLAKVHSRDELEGL